MQPSHGFSRGFKRHFVTIAVSANAQTHVITTQGVIGGFIIDIGEFLRRSMNIWPRSQTLRKLFRYFWSSDEF